MTDSPTRKSAEFVWIPDFTSYIQSVLGQDWPLVIVERWEYNKLGERRFLDARIYQLASDHARSSEGAGETPR